MHHNLIKTGITGQAGFIGSHLYNYLGIYSDVYERIWFEDDYFYDDEKFHNFLKQCDVIVHFAALNRHNKPEEIYSKNIELVERLIKGLETVNTKPHILFSSSTQESLDNVYGRSKREGREMLKRWCRKSGAKFTGLVIPNVFGPFGRPFYNSVVSTFSYQLTHNQTPRIDVDNNMKLIYVNELVKIIEDIIRNKIYSDSYEVSFDFESKVTDLLDKMNYYYETYINNSIIPELKSHNDINLFNTLRSYIEYDELNRKIEKKTDERGYLTEITKALTEGQTFFSETKPGIIRGNHFHLRKIERFSVIRGEAIIRLRKIGSSNVVEYRVCGDEPSYIDIPIWHTHNIENTGKGNLLTLFWANEIYNPKDADTYFEKV